MNRFFFDVDGCDSIFLFIIFAGVSIFDAICITSSEFWLVLYSKLGSDCRLFSIEASEEFSIGSIYNINNNVLII